MWNTWVKGKKSEEGSETSVFKDNFLIDFPLDWLELFPPLELFSEPLTISSLVFHRLHFSLSRITCAFGDTTNKVGKQLCRWRLTPWRLENKKWGFKPPVIFSLSRSGAKIIFNDPVYCPAKNLLMIANAVDDFSQLQLPIRHPKAGEEESFHEFFIIMQIQKHETKNCWGCGWIASCQVTVLKFFDDKESNLDNGSVVTFTKKCRNHSEWVLEILLKAVGDLNRFDIFCQVMSLLQNMLYTPTLSQH